jgi:hypothetical protein
MATAKFLILYQLAVYIATTFGVSVVFPGCILVGYWISPCLTNPTGVLSAPFCRLHAQIFVHRGSVEDLPDHRSTSHR